jgi:hypothetical protein
MEEFGYLVDLRIKEAVDPLCQLVQSGIGKRVVLKNQGESNDLQDYENNLETKPDYESNEVLHCSSCYLIRNGNRLMFLRAIPVPLATE